MQRYSGNHHTGYTLVEALVAFTMFSILLGGALSLITTAAQTQRRSIGIQDVVGELSFVGETMTRAIRQQQKDVNDECLTIGVNDKLNYEVTHSGEGIKFIDREGDCREFYLSGETLMDNNLTTAVDQAITSDKVRVLTFDIKETGAAQTDNIQPSVTFLLEVESTRAPGVSRIHVQSTITQRTLDSRR